MIRVRREAISLICCGAIRFPHIEMFSECINLQKGSLRKEIYLKSTYKGCFLCVLKDFDQSK